MRQVPVTFKTGPSLGAAHPHVVIVGAGFAGLAAAHELDGTEFEVTLIDVHNFHTFQPLLYQVATAGLDPADIAFPIRAAFSRRSNVGVRKGKVVQIHLDERFVELSDGSLIPYDSLVVATGATTSFFAIAGASEHAMPLYTLHDARALRNAILSMLESFDARSATDTDRGPRFVVVGGGPTGVEVAGAIVELLDISEKRDRLQVRRRQSSVVLIDAADRLLGGFEEVSSHYALDQLTRLGVEVRCSSAVESIDDQAVRLTDGSSIPADLVVWAGGVTVNRTIADSLPGERSRGGRVAVRPNLSLPEHSEVFVAGDAAAVPLDRDTAELAPQVAQVAIQSGRHAAKQLVAAHRGSDTDRFTYKDKGMMATIGRRVAVAEIKGPAPLGSLNLKGTLGWLAWLFLHLVYLLGIRNRLAVLLNWTWRYLEWPAGPRVIVEDNSGIESALVLPEPSRV